MKGNTERMGTEKRAKVHWAKHLEKRSNKPICLPAAHLRIHMFIYRGRKTVVQED